MAFTGSNIRAEIARNRMSMLADGDAHVNRAYGRLSQFIECINIRMGESSGS